MAPTSHQLRRIRAALPPSCRDRKARCAFYSRYFGRLVCSARALSQAEAEDLLAYLYRAGYAIQLNWAAFDLKNPQHRCLLSLCRQYGWETTHEKHGRVADLERLDRWLRSSRAPVRLPLQAMSKAQCSKTIAALESMVIDKYGKL